MKIKRIENILDGTGVISQPTCEPMSHERYLSEVVQGFHDAMQDENYPEAAAHLDIMAQIIQV